ncbi:MAG: hypothetical protein J0H68_03485 [Sphingobacteriia bacterium]|nr:hypothetical protein [Sphingobacteriia bacterium]
MLKNEANNRRHVKDIFEVKNADNNFEVFVSNFFSRVSFIEINTEKLLNLISEAKEKGIDLNKYHPLRDDNILNAVLSHAHFDFENRDREKILAIIDELAKNEFDFNSLDSIGRSPLIKFISPILEKWQRDQKELTGMLMGHPSSVDNTFKRVEILKQSLKKTFLQKDFFYELITKLIKLGADPLLKHPHTQTDFIDLVRHIKTMGVDTTFLEKAIIDGLEAKKAKELSLEQTRNEVEKKRSKSEGHKQGK